MENHNESQIEALVEEGDQFFRRMKNERSKVEYNNIFFNSLLKIYLLGGRQEQAILLLEEMKGMNIYADSITISTIVKLHNANNVSEAQIVTKLISKLVDERYFDLNEVSHAEAR